MINQYFDYDAVTNSPTWYKSSGLIGTGYILWHTFHKKYWYLEDLKKLPWWEKAEKIFLIGQEANMFYNRHDDRVYMMDGQVDLGQPRYYHYFWWFDATRKVDNMTNFSHRLTDPRVNTPEYTFDCIMGNPRPHRQVIYETVTKSKWHNKVAMSYNAANSLTQIQGSSDLPCPVTEWLPGWDDSDILHDGTPLNTADLTCTLVQYKKGIDYPFTVFLPYALLNRSWFSILAETRHQQTFFTEKTGKVLLGKKLFVFVGAQHALKELQIAGYKTFDGIIDESYDSEPNEQTRWKKALEQVDFIMNQDPMKIYEEALPILEHNYNHLKFVDHEQVACEVIKSWI